MDESKLVMHIRCAQNCSVLIIYPCIQSLNATRPQYAWVEEVVLIHDLIRSSRADYIEASVLIVEVDANKISNLLRSEYLRTE